MSEFDAVDKSNWFFENPGYGYFHMIGYMDGLNNYYHALTGDNIKYQGAYDDGYAQGQDVRSKVERNTL